MSALPHVSAYYEHMQASESLTARSLKAKLLVLRLGCTCSILIEPDASTCFRDPTQGWLVLALLGCGKLTHTHICRSRACGLWERASAVECEVIIHGSYFGQTMLLANRRFPQGHTCTGEIHPWQNGNGPEKSSRQR